VIRILLAEDQAMMRGALAVLLDLEEDLEVVAQVDDGEDIVPTALRVRPDVALLDIELPHVSGLEAAERLATALPECRVVIVTTFARTGYLQLAMAAGAQGYLEKHVNIEALASAMWAALA
jgi:two-component system response regulator DesR